MTLLLLERPKVARSVVTPYERQQQRINNGQERATPHPQMGSGSLFVLKATAPTSGSIAYGLKRWTLDIHQILIDGGVQTWDDNLAGPLRDIGIFNETIL